MPKLSIVDLEVPAPAPAPAPARARAPAASVGFHDPRFSEIVCLPCILFFSLPLLLLTHTRLVVVARVARLLRVLQQCDNFFVAAGPRDVECGFARKHPVSGPRDVGLVCHKQSGERDVSRLRCKVKRFPVGLQAGLQKNARRWEMPSPRSPVERICAHPIRGVDQMQESRQNSRTAVK